MQNFQVHFVEMDPWVVSNVLRPNLEWTGFLDASVIHSVRVENFLERSERFLGTFMPLLVNFLSLPPFFACKESSCQMIFLQDFDLSSSES